MPAAEWHNPEFNDWLTSGAEEGYVSMMTSALGQHIMPFVQNDMNDWSVSIENDMVDYRYDYFPKIAWIPERVWLSPGVYPEAGVIDWLGDNWTQHGVEAVVLHGIGAKGPVIPCIYVRVGSDRLAIVERPAVLEDDGPCQTTIV